MEKLISTFLLVLYTFCASAQTDSTLVLSYQDYIKIVINEHPFVKQAAIKIYEGEAKLLYARGAFDPKIYTDVSQKYFKGKQYYNNVSGGLKIPTWFGIELKGAYEQNEGLFLNPSSTTPNAGLLYAGISVPLGKGLLIDKRRAELKKAQLFQQVSEMKKQIILNELIYMAGMTYWKWFKNYNTLLVYKDAYRLSKERYEAVKLGVNAGARAAIDTLEAGIQVQNRLLGLQQTAVKFKNASVLLSIYLWAEGVVPLELAEGTIPIPINTISTSSANLTALPQLETLIDNHPELNKSRYIIKQLEVDQRLKKNQQLPLLNLKYNPITEYKGGESLGNYSVNDYTWGLQFQIPILLRKERGALKLAKLKIQDYNLQLNNKQEILRYKLTAAWNQWSATTEQIKLYAQTVEDAGNLLKGEQQLFNIGESSLFMVNSREVGYIKTQLKFIKLVAENKNAELTTMYATGRLSNQ